MIKRIGVELKEGCDISGGDLAIKSLQDMIDFDEILSIDPGLIIDEEPLFLHAVSDLNTRLKRVVSQSLKEGHFPLVFGGDHALAIGSISASLTKDTGVIWIDAHGDCNTVESSPSHRIHGMPLAVLQGYGHPKLTHLNDTVLNGVDILQIGIRSLDEEEALLMKKWGVRIISMQDIKSEGWKWAKQELSLFIDHHPRLHVSFDCDSVDPKEAPGVNTPSKNGLSVREVLDIFDTLPFEKVSSMDIVEYNPTKDDEKTKAMILKIDALVHLKRGAL
ncbi:MAG: arginase [Erysipelotrichaceae bacterium]|nr:arginase [Erysipelotrichaceae bacterium]